MWQFVLKLCVWLHDLGFTQKHHHKTVYFHGHEREDIVAYRKEYVDKMLQLDRRCLYPGHTPELLPGVKPLIQIHHDESTFYANADQSSYWGDGTLSVLKQKSLGQSIMVSDFIEEAVIFSRIQWWWHSKADLRTCTGTFQQQSINCKVTPLTKCL